ncbi:hypothetical protein EVAR_35823_1 [Eumeta japonica]|uniref:Uncharacterized protein n=1 Tax=Eumeta variegata TaxID=151549 RepID=A0A4C1WZT1_EUMVA|nr:hypothetical protein EVAR_35823_1 [Eumeta japonica]
MPLVCSVLLWTSSIGSTDVCRLFGATEWMSYPSSLSQAKDTALRFVLSLIHTGRERLDFKKGYRPIVHRLVLDDVVSSDRRRRRGGRFGVTGVSSKFTSALGIGPVYVSSITGRRLGFLVLAFLVYATQLLGKRYRPQTVAGSLSAAGRQFPIEELGRRESRDLCCRKLHHLNFRRQIQGCFLEKGHKKLSELTSRSAGPTLPYSKGRRPVFMFNFLHNEPSQGHMNYAQRHLPPTSDQLRTRSDETSSPLKY